MALTSPAQAGVQAGDGDEGRRAPSRLLSRLDPGLRRGTSNFVLLLLALLPAPAAAQSLSERVAAARSGARIVAPASGEVLEIRGKRFSPPVTIVGGRLSKASIVDSSGVTFRGTVFERAGGGDAAPLLYVRDSSDVAVADAQFRGGRALNGVSLRTVRRFAITGSRFAGLRNGLRGVDVDGLTARRNRFADIAIDAIGFGGARDAEIAESEFRTDASEKAGHPDAIQFWDVAGIVSRGIVVRDNLIDVAAQGIFVKSEGKGGFDAVSILRNDVRTSYGNAIWLSGARGSTVAGNRIRSRTDRFHMAKLVLRDNRGLTLDDNAVCKMLDAGNVGTVGRVTLGWSCPPEP